MAMILSGTSIKATVNTMATNIDTAETEVAQLNLAKEASFTLAAGELAGMADSVWARTGTILTNDEWDINLNGVEVNAFGDTIAFTEIKAILIYNQPHDGDPQIEVGAAPANEFVSWVGAALDLVVVHAGGVFLLGSPGNATTNGYETAAGTHILRIRNDNGAPNDGVNSAIVEVVIVGCIA